MTSHQELLSITLPKWPQMYVTGTPVAVQQAKEIIRRTDSFFTGGIGGNNREYDRWVRQLVGMPPGFWDRPYTPLPDNATEEEKSAFYAKRRKEYEDDLRAQDEFFRRWKPLRTHYVHNTWVSCAFLGGPHGWCHPDGEIGYVDTIGKWPKVEEVYSDWTMLAEAFPFIDCGITLYDGERGEDGARPLVSIRVKDGKATLTHATEDVHAGHKKARRRSNSVGSSVSEFMTNFKTNFNNPRREQGIDDAWIYEWAEKYGPKKKTASLRKR